MQFLSRAPARSIAIAIAALSGVSSASAMLTFNVVQVGNDVVITASGSADVTPASFNLGGPGTSIGGSQVWYTTSGPLLSVGSGNQDLYSRTQPFFTDEFLIRIPGSSRGAMSFLPSQTSGGIVGFGQGGSLNVPAGYVSGTPLASSSTFSNQTLSSMGFVTGTYTGTWGSGVHADSFVLNVGVPAVPELGTLSLALAGFGCVSVIARRSRRRGTLV